MRQLRMNAYCIFIHTLGGEKVPAWRGTQGHYLLYPTERDAQLEIAEDLIEKLRQFRDGERNFEDAIGMVDFIEPVIAHDDGTFVDAEGNRYGPWELQQDSVRSPSSRKKAPPPPL
jgi:hypothetical protein